uniref:Uncharacterized protein n=1 Tax=Meloidogyne enterolobii TaxID=390850 RepID=A0A6V7UER4_MELEN|nr:unnamed protein product [Meloidogyne enterolobii]
MRYLFKQFSNCVFEKVCLDKDYRKILFTILTTGGHKFSKVCCKHPKLSGLHAAILQHKETLTDTSNMVKEIIFEDAYGSEKRIHS